MEIVAFIVLLSALAYIERRRSPECHWCESRHFGRCIYNPRSGRFWSNANDGQFDNNNPNQ
jgi:hypothetical protein